MTKLTATQIDVLDKVRKLLAKAASLDADSPEAITYVEKAEELLNRHSLERSQIPEEQRDDKIIEMPFFIQYAGDAWRKRMAMAIARIHFTKVLFSKALVPVRGGSHQWRPSFILVGRELNCEVTKSMIEYLFNNAIRMSKNYAQSLRKSGQYVDDYARHQYEGGMAMKLISRLDVRFEELTTPKEEIKDHGGLPALYDNERSVIQEYMDRNMKIRSVSVKSIKAQGEAAWKGFNDGDSVSLDKQIAGTGKASSKFLLGNS